MADGRPRRRSTALSRIEEHGAPVLLAAGAVAWALAAWQVEHEAVASSWALSGFLLIVAATFHSRVLEVGRDGVKLADVVDALDDIAPDDTRDEVKAKVLDDVVSARTTTPDWYSHYASWLRADPVTDPWKRALTLQRSYQAGRLSAAFRDWLARDRWEVTEEVASHRFRIDLVAQQGDTKLYAEVRSAVNTLTSPDARKIIAALQTLPPDGEKALVFAAGTAITNDAHLDLRDANIAIYFVDPETGAVHQS